MAVNLTFLKSKNILLFLLIQSKKLQGEYTITKQYLGENEIHSTSRPNGRFTIVSFGHNFPACPQ